MMALTFKKLSKKLSNLSLMAKAAAGLGLLLVLAGSFGACRALDDDADTTSTSSTKNLPDWSNDPTKIHPK